MDVYISKTHDYREFPVLENGIDISQNKLEKLKSDYEDCNLGIIDKNVVGDIKYLITLNELYREMFNKTTKNNLKLNREVKTLMNEVEEKDRIIKELQTYIEDTY